MLILASSSPRRKELLKFICEDFIVESADIEETLDLNTDLESAMEKLAFQKALPVFNKHPEDIVIAADTVVVFNKQIIGKPKDREDAIRILQTLSGNTHQVITGVCIISKKTSMSFNVVTEVSFYPLEEKEIINYIDKYHPYDKAGAYAIQEKAALFVKEIKGDYYNIMGLPIARLNQELTQIINCEIG